MDSLRILFNLETDSMNYYIKDTINKNLSVRELESKIKSNEYERLPIETKNKLILDDKIEVKDLRNSIKRLGGTMPEDLPTPNKSLKELERKC